jgi:flagellar biosynthetic protein FliP
MMDNQLDEETGFARAIEPFHDFMLKHTRQKDLDLFVEMGQAPAGKNDVKTPPAPAAAPNGASATGAAGKTGVSDGSDVSLRALIPAFMLSELRRAFEIGFLLFLPFLIIDMVVASILMSMGMMMLPPSIISLPFKIIFFVLVDGWYLIAGSLVQSYGGG